MSGRSTRKFDPVRDIYRGSCKCGKWLLIMPCHTEEEPLVCHGPCHQGIECGRSYVWTEEKVIVKEP